MDSNRIDFIRKHHVSAPCLCAIILGVILFKFTGLGAKTCVIIAFCVGISDYAAAAWLLKKWETRDD